MNKQNRGITLIALIITIIILLILAGVTINVLIGDNGLLNTAKNAGESYKIAEITERIQADIIDKQIEKGGTISERNLEKVLKKYGSLSTEEENLLDKTLITNEGNHKIKVLDIYNGKIEKYQVEEENNGLIGEISRIQNSGYSNISVTGRKADNTEETVSYNIHTIVYNGNLVLDGTMEIEGATLNSNTYEFGNKTTDVATETKDASNMVVLKVNGDLIINENVILTACKSDNGYGGPKGMLIYCTGKITNNGTISMTARGARAEGQDVYLWQNDDESYEYVPEIGGNGGASVTGYCYHSAVGYVAGDDGIERRTGGGGGGGAHAWYGTTLTAARGGNGTSYSGGSGAGSYMRHNGGYPQPDLELVQGSDIGGQGGQSYVYWDTANDTFSGGVGNPGGIGSRNNDTTRQTASGTGGLLIIFATELENNNQITAKGISPNLPNEANGRNPGNASGGRFYQYILKSRFY